jgi:hypothetical protein
MTLDWLELVGYDETLGHTSITAPEYMNSDSRKQDIGQQYKELEIESKWHIRLLGAGQVLGQ